MDRDHTKQRFDSIPYFYVKGNVVSEVGDRFLELTGYEKDDMIDKDINYLCCNLLRLNVNIDEFQDSNKSFFMFTKGLEPREVEIECILNGEFNQKVYIFTERPFSRIEDKFKSVHQICIDNILSVSIYSVPDLILLEASQKYLDFFDPPNNTRENCIGKCIYDFVSGWKNSPSEAIWREVISSGKSTVVKEQKHVGFDRGITYWDAIIMPIFEDGKVKFITSQTTDATEKVTNRNRAEEHANALNEKNMELQAVVDSISDDLYIIEKDGTIKTVNSSAKIVFNKRANNIYENYNVSKYFDISGNEITLDEMPSLCLLRGEKIKGREIQIKRGSSERYVSVSGTPIVDRGGKVQKAVYCHQDITKYILQSKTIAEQKDQLEAIIENMSDGLFMLDRNHKFTFLNQAGREFFFQSDKIAKNGDSFKHTRYYDLEGKELTVDEMVGSRVLRGEVVKQFRMKVVRPDKTIYYSLSGSPIYDTDGGISHAIICCRDITEVIEKDKEIKKQQEYLKIITEKMSDAIMIISQDGKYSYFNDSALKMTYRPENLDRHGDSFIQTKYFYENGVELKKEDLPAFKVLKGEVFNNVILKGERPDKIAYYSFNGKPVYDEAGNIVSAIVTVTDITERKRMEEVLVQTNDKLALALESVDAGIWEWNIVTNEQVWSPKVYEIYGVVPTEAVPLEKGISRVYQDDKEDFENSLDEALKTHSEFWHKDFRIINPNKGIVWLKGAGKIVYDQAGTPVKMVGINIDVTEQKNQQEQLIYAEREKNETLENAMKMKDEFLATITHEFKTPLTVINAALQTIDSLYGSQVSDNVKKHLKRIRMNSYRQLRLVNNLLDITRYNAGHIKLNKKNIDIIFLSKAIVKSVDLYAKQKGLELVFMADCDYKEMGIDEEKYERILLNLLSNAIKFSPKGKCIYVNISFEKSKAIISVRDEGIGIPKNKQKEIFERFGQVDSSLSRQAEGTGIGLSLVKTLITALGGTISVESDVGKGTNFTLTLPAKKLRRIEPQLAMAASQDSRIMQAAEIEFSDIYLG